MMDTQYRGTRGIATPYESNVKIVRMTITPLGQYHNQFHRPYETHVDNTIIDRFNQHFHNKREYEASAFTGVTKGFLRYAEREDEVSIDNGWDCERHRFLMEVVSTNFMGLEVREFVSGYTDRPEGITPQGVVALGHQAGLVYVDPQVRFYINGIINVMDQRRRTPMGVKTYRTMRSNMHVMADQQYEGYHSGTEARLKPADIFYAMDGELLNTTHGMGTTYDTRFVNDTEARLSRRSNVLPTHYASSIFEGFSKTLKADQSTMTDAMSTGSVYAQAANLIREDHAMDDCFIRHLSRVTHQSHQSKVFRFQDLLKLDPTIGDRVEGMVGTRGESIRTHTLGDSVDWTASDHETTAALMIAQSVAAILSSMSVMFVDFSMSNMNSRNEFGMGSNAPLFSVAAINMLNNDPDYDQRRIVDAVEWRVWHEILRNLTEEGMISFDLRVICDLTGETTIHLGMDGDPQRSWVFPTFADAMLTPLVTANYEAPSAIAHDFKTMLDVVVEKPNYQPEYLDIRGERGYEYPREDRREERFGELSSIIQGDYYQTRREVEENPDDIEYLPDSPNEPQRNTPTGRKGRF